MKSFSFRTLFYLLFSLVFLASCDWQDLPSYDEAEISAFQFYHRWASEEKDPITGEPVVKEKRLETKVEIDSDNSIVSVEIQVPAASGDFTEAARSGVSLSKLWGQATVSTAARITPLDGGARLGTPDDWTKEKRFEVKAANGDVRIWTVKVVGFVK